jgi:hypothetical protein
MPDYVIELIDGDKRTRLDVKKFSFSQEFSQLWSDGTIDGSYIEKVVGYQMTKQAGEALLNDGRVIRFGNVEQASDGSIVIRPPYTFL